MSTRVTLHEIAGALDVHRTSALRRAEREAWPFTEESVRGGKQRLFTVSDLPSEVRAALLQRAVAAVTPAALPVAAQSHAPIADAELTDRQRLGRDARIGVLAAVQRLQREAGCSQEAALTTLLTSARAGRLDEHLDRMLQLARDPRGRAGDGYPSTRTLKRWLAAIDLAPRVPRASFNVPAWAKVFLAEYQQPQKPSVESAYRAACQQWPAEERPSIHQCRRLLARLGSVTRERGRMGPRELKNIQPFVRRTFDQLQPNDVWSADGHTFDAEVQHPLHGRPFRPEITTFVDIATRRVVGWSVDLAESSHAVADALRYGVERCGIPAILYVDNGSGYRNAMMSDAATGLVGRLGCTIQHSLPYNSQARGVIERAHQTIWVAGAKQLPAFMGAHMDREARLEQFRLSRRALKAGGVMPLMPWHLFVQWCEQQVTDYNTRAHRSLGNTSPDLAWANHIARGWEPETLDTEQLATLFRPRITRTLNRAEIRLFNNIYFARELEEFHGLEAHIAYDIHNASRVWVYAPDGRLICTAEANGNAKHYFPVPVVEQARQKRAKGRLAKVDTKRDEILAELHGGPAIAAPASNQIVIGGRVIDPSAVPAALAERTAVLDAIEATPTPPPSSALRSQRPAAENYAEWLQIGKRLETGAPVREEDSNFYKRWPDNAQGRAWFKRMAREAAEGVKQ